MNTNTIKAGLLSSALIMACSQFATAAIPEQNVKTLTPAQSVANQEKLIAQDEEIVAFLIALNQHEYVIARLATTKKVNSAVKTYANIMMDDHEDNLKDTESLSKVNNLPENITKDVASFKAEGKEELKNLSELDNHDFEVAYIDERVEGLESALEMLAKFAKEATNEDLKKQIAATSEAIQKQLANGKEIQAVLEKKK